MGSDIVEESIHFFGTGSVMVLVTGGICVPSVADAIGGFAAGEQKRARQGGNEREESEMDS